MPIEEKLKKLLHLRQLRELASSGALSSARANYRARQDDLQNAEVDFEKLQQRRVTETRAALRRAENVRDSGARFAGIAITLQKQAIRIENALEHIELCEDQVENARSRTSERKAEFLTRLHDTQKSETLLEGAQTARCANDALAEDEEVAEIFASRRGTLS